MAAGVIKNKSDFRPTFPLPFLSLGGRDMDFQETSEEEEEMEETTSRLLNFSELINGDIQKYFGRKGEGGDPDACNIYEDRFCAGKSGRELYYADLIRIAHNRDPEDEDSPWAPRDRESSRQLGPLAELFEYGLREYAKRSEASSRRREGDRQRLARKYAHVVPMHRRRLPSSFWREPVSPTPGCLLHTSHPDFSDLLANWTSESNGPELPAARETAGEINTRSPESYRVM